MSSLIRWLTLGLVALASAPQTSSATEEQQPRAGIRLQVGPPAALYAMPGVDAHRSRQSRTQLSAAPHVASRMRIAYGIGRGLVVGDAGRFVVAHPASRASGFDAQGKLLYSLKLASEPASAPVVNSAGLVALVAQGELLGIETSGRIRFRVALGLGADAGARASLATRDGGVLLASGSNVLKVSALGALEWRTAAPEPILELLEAESTLLALSEPGSIFALGPAGRWSRLGELGAPTGSATLDATGTRLLARAGNHRVVSFELGSRRLQALLDDTTLELDGPVLLAQQQQALAFSSDGLLVRLRADGSELQRVPIDPGARRAPGPELVLLLGDGRLLIARQAADAIVVSASGEVTPIATSACPDPVGVYPAAPGAVLLGCRSGSLLRLE